MSAPILESLPEKETNIIEISAPVYETGLNKHPAATRPNIFSWFDPNDGPIERRLILKLDFFILTYACIGFWTLYIDRGILQNAYVSGMREDLKLLKNQFVELNAVYTTGYATSMIPATLLITKLPPHRVIPTSMSLWALFTLLCYRAQSFSELCGYRFIVGFFTGPFFCSMHYVIGSWYRPDEIVRRSGIFYVSASLGTLSTGLLAARIYESLDGALGHAGWRWMYIIGAIITFPVAIWGFFTFPGTPAAGKRWIFTEEEYQLAVERMILCGRKDPVGFKFELASFKRFFGRWHWYVLVPWNVLWLLGYLSLNQGAYTLWLKAQKQYSIPEVNNFTAVSPGLGIAFILTFSWLADRYGDNARLIITGITCTVGFISNMAFVLYGESSFSWKWFAVATSYMEVSLSPLIYSWVNIICAGDAEERAFVISSMLAVGTAFSTWVPLLAFQTVKSPQFHTGYVMQLILQPVYFSATAFVWFVVRRTRKGKKLAAN